MGEGADLLVGPFLIPAHNQIEAPCLGQIIPELDRLGELERRIDVQQGHRRR